MSRRHAAFASVFVALCAVASLAACGGGGGGGGGGGNPASPPVGMVAIVFPPVGGVTEAPTLVVRGTASSLDGIVGVTVDGVPATSGDGFATWSATVPLVAGANDLAVVATTGTGSLPAVPVHVACTPVIDGELFGVAFDPTDGRILTLGGVDGRLVVRDEASGVSTVVSSDTIGTGSTLSSAYPLAVVPGGGTAYATTNHGGTARVLAIDLATGNRTEVSGPNKGQGTPFGTLASMAVDLANSRILVADVGAVALVAVNLATGDRTVFSSANVGTGPMFAPNTAMNLVLDASHGRAIFQSNGEYVAVGLADGNRTTLSGQAVGSGPSVSACDVALDAAANKMYALSRFAHPDLLVVDLATGVRAKLPHPAAPAGGEELGEATSVALDAAGGRLLVSDWGGAAVRSIDVTTGVRSIVRRPGRGAGPEIPAPAAAVLEDDDHVLVVEPSASGAILRVTLSTGDRVPLGGAGPVPVTSPGVSCAITLDSAHGRALYVGQNSASLSGVVGVDLATGARTILSNGLAAFGPQLPSGAYGIATDGTTAWFTPRSTPEKVLRADLSTGQRTVVVDANTGAGPAFSSALALVHDAAAGRLLVGAIVPGDGGLYSVDPATGDRTPVLTGAVGTGSDNNLLVGLSWAPDATLRAVQALSVRSIDPVSQVGATLSSPTLGGGVLLGSPMLAGVRTDGIVLVVDGATASVIAVDPENGTRVLVSK